MPSLSDLLDMEFPEEKRTRRGAKPPIISGLPANGTDGSDRTDGAVSGGRGSTSLPTGSPTVLASAVAVAEKLVIAQIRRDGGTQPRQGLNEEVVTEYKDARLAGADFPVVDVVFDGKDYWLTDGFHRVEAYLRAGDTEIGVNITRGTQAEAQWRSYGANRMHGLRRSTEDKQRAVRLALEHANAATMSNRQIAQHVGVDDKTIAKYRNSMELTSEIPKSELRRGLDGREIRTEKIGPGKQGQSRMYAPIVEIEGYVREWLRGYESPHHGADKAALLKATRHANSPSRPHLEQWLADRDLDLRKADLTQAIDNVRSQMAALSTPGNSPSAEFPQVQIPPASAPTAPGGLRPSRYTLPDQLTAPTSPTPSLAPPNNYAPVFLLEQRVRAAVGEMIKSGLIDAPADDLRTLVALALWESTETGRGIMKHLAGLEYRREDLIGAVQKVAAAYEAAGERPLPAWLGAEFRTETLRAAEGLPLAQNERKGALAGELAYWQGALVRLALVGDLTGQHTVTLGLRREIEKIIQLYKTEGGQ